MSATSFFNGLMIFMLRSPLHGIVSGRTMLITVAGRKSGREYTTPVNYVQTGGGFLVTSRRDRIWWRNLRDGGPARLRLRGQGIEATGQAIEDPDGVAQAMGEFLSSWPALARRLRVELTPEGEPNPADLARLAESRVMIRLRPAP